MNFFSKLLLSVLSVGISYLVQKYFRISLSDSQVSLSSEMCQTYAKVYELMKHFYKKDSIQSLGKYKTLSNEILQIFNNCKCPYNHELTDYLENICNNKRIENNWRSFIYAFDRDYDQICRNIGIPLRRFTFRFNNHQYYDAFHLAKIAIARIDSTVISNVLFSAFLIAILLTKFFK